MIVAFERHNSFLLKAISVLLITCIFSMLGFVNQAYAYDNPLSHTEHSDSTAYNYGAGWNDIYGSSSLGYMGAEWSSARNAWCFNYRLAGTGASRFRDTGNSTNTIRIAAMEIEGTSNTSNLALWTSTDSKYVGSTPGSGTNPDYSTIATAVAGFAITAINNLGASYAWSTLGLIGALRSYTDSSTTQDDYIWRDWDWSSDISDTGQFFWFLADVEPNETVQISYDYMIFGPGYELLDTGKGYRNLVAPGPDSKSAVTNWNPGMMSEDDKEKYGIEEITLEKVNERAAELNIASEIINEFKDSGDEVLYYAHKLIEYEVVPSIDLTSQESKDILTKDALMEEIIIQIQNKEIIIKAFSNIEELTEENANIIKENEAELAFLKDILKEAELVNEDDSKYIDSLWNELQERI